MEETLEGEERDTFLVCIFGVRFKNLSHSVKVIALPASCKCDCVLKQF